MKIFRVLLGLFFLVMSKNVTCQNENFEKINSLIESFAELSVKNGDFEVEFVEENNTLIFNFLTRDFEETNYKAILIDIHPQGIFYFKQGENEYIRILSVDNGSRFIKTKFKNGFRISNTTNVIDIQILNGVNSEKVEEVIKDLKGLFKKQELESSEDIISISLPKKGN